MIGSHKYCQLFFDTGAMVIQRRKNTWALIHIQIKHVLDIDLTVSTKINIKLMIDLNV